MVIKKLLINVEIPVPGGEQVLCAPHGTFVGDAGGPDYMCGMCENGD